MTYKTLLKRLVLLVAIIFLWELASQRVNNLFIPKPEKVLSDPKRPSIQVRILKRHWDYLYLM